MNELDTSTDTLADEVDVASTDGQETDSTVGVKDALSKALGKDFKDDATALKAVKDTFNYVGKAGKFLPYIEQLQEKYGGEKNVIELMEELTKTDAPEAKEVSQPKVDESKFVSREQYEADTFFSKRPELEPHRELLDALRSKTGKSLSEAAELPSFKNVFEKVKAYEETQNSKSVLHTNPRLGQAVDKVSKSRTALSEGRVAEATETAVDAVLDAFERE